MMSKEERIRKIEKRLIDIFNQDTVRAIDVLIANTLFDDWKRLNNYKPASSNPIIDKEPSYDGKM